MTFGHDRRPSAGQVLPSAVRRYSRQRDRCCRDSTGRLPAVDLRLQRDMEGSYISPKAPLGVRTHADPPECG